MRQLRLTTHARAGCAVVSLQGELDIASAEDLREELGAARRSHGDHIILDLDALEFMDSFGLSVIASAYKTLTGEGGSLTLVAPRPIVRRTLEITGLHQRISVYATVEAAATALRPGGVPRQDAAEPSSGRPDIPGTTESPPTMPAPTS